MSELDRVRWRCRRGILELDVIFERFLNTQYDTLSFSQQLQFSELLSYPDAELWAWVGGASRCEHEAFAPLLTQLRTGEQQRL